MPGRPLRLTSLDNPRLKRVVQLRKHRDRRESNLFIAEGVREFQRALAAGLRLVELFWSPDLTGTSAAQLQSIFPALDATASLYEMTPSLLHKIAYREKPEGYVAVFEAPAWSLDGLPDNPNPLYLIASDIEKPGNLGAMARTAAAAGATALLVADEQVDAFNPNAIRASTGAVFSLPIVSATSERLVGFLRERRVSIIAAAPDATTAHTDIDLSGPVAIVIGAEDVGLSSPWRRAADHLVAIPMRTDIVDSLNASNAAAIMLFEAVRQRACRE